MGEFAPRGIVPSLPGGEIHLWAVALDPPAALAARLAGCLADDEQQRAGGFRFAPHRRRYQVGRGAPLPLPGGYLGRPPSAVQFASGDRGKPFLAEPRASAGDLQFNLSNSAE